MTEPLSFTTRFADVPGYRVERMLGQGGFAVVLSAVTPDGQRVALKVATSGDAVAAAQLASEEKALRAIGPPAAPAVLGSARLPDGSPYLALELLQAPTLAERLREIAERAGLGVLRLVVSTELPATAAPALAAAILAEDLAPRPD